MGKVLSGVEYFINAGQKSGVVLAEHAPKERVHQGGGFVLAGLSERPLGRDADQSVDEGDRQYDRLAVHAIESLRDQGDRDDELRFASHEGHW